MEFETCEVEANGEVATVRIVPPKNLVGGTSDLHWDLGEVFSALRGRNDIRVVIVTGMQDEFYVPMRADFYRGEKARRYLSDPAGAWRTFTGIIRLHQALVEIEKPVIASVNGDAIGFGSSLAFACDLIVAAEDAQFVDIHLGMAEAYPGPDFGIVPGDGGASLIPLFFSPAKAKEYLMLGKAYSGRELAEMNLINAATTGASLESRTNEFVEALLRRPAYALAWTKRVANRHIAQNLNLSLDAAAAYEMINFLQLDRLGGNEPRSLA